LNALQRSFTPSEVAKPPKTLTARPSVTKAPASKTPGVVNFQKLLKNSTTPRTQQSPNQNVSTSPASISIALRSSSPLSKAATAPRTPNPPKTP